MAKRPFNGSPTVDGYYTTFDSSEVHRVDEGGSDEGGGGGSSDFSTAKVKIINNNANRVEAGVVLCPLENHVANWDFRSGFVFDETTGIHSEVDFKTLGSGEYSEATYYFLKDKNCFAEAFLAEITPGVTIAYSVEGDGEISYYVSEEDNNQVPCVIITGDCTITIS